MIQRRERGVESRVVIENCPRAVNVSRRAKFRGNARKIDIFAIEMTIAIVKKSARECSDNEWRFPNRNARFLGSARVSRVGFGVSPKQLSEERRVCRS